jgi:hypothetical protein
VMLTRQPRTHRNLHPISKVASTIQPACMVMAIIVHLLDLHVNVSTPVGACSMHAWSTELGRGCQPDCAMYSTTFVPWSLCGGCTTGRVSLWHRTFVQMRMLVQPSGKRYKLVLLNTSTHKVEHYQREPGSKRLTKAEATRLAEMFNQNDLIEAR